MQIIQTVHMYFNKMHDKPVNSEQCRDFHYFDYDRFQLKCKSRGNDDDDFGSEWRSLIFVVSNLLSL